MLSNRKLRPKARVHLIDAREMWEKMPKSLGDKRKRLGMDDIAEITRIYGDRDSSPVSKVFTNDDFGYWRITVEQPLRQRYDVTAEAIETVRLSKPFIKLAAPPKNSKDPQAAVAKGHRAQERLLGKLHALEGLSGQDRDAIAANLEPALVDEDGSKLDGYVRSAIWKAIATPDPTAPIVREGKKDKPDPDLRDYEHVPLAEDIDEFVEREVRPWVSEAWVDKTKTKVGYEIPFTAIFYEYKPPRPLEEIDAEVRVLEREVLELLRDAGQ